MTIRSEARAPLPRLLGISFEYPGETVARLRKIGLGAALHYPVSLLLKIEAFLRAKGAVVRPLVPENELAICQRQSIATLLARDPSHEWGDYLEFGVFQGHSMSLMYRNLVELDVPHGVRLFGFDSFQGYPDEAANETSNFYEPGGDKSPEWVARRLLTERGADWDRITLVKGWFSDTLTPEFKAKSKPNGSVWSISTAIFIPRPRKRFCS